MQKELISNLDALTQSREFLKRELGSFDEVWQIGHRPTHMSLYADGVVTAPITVSHVHADMGLQAARHYPVPLNSSGAYEDLLTAINPAIANEVHRVVTTGKKAALFMPFPNSGLDRMLKEYDPAIVAKCFVSTTSTPDFKSFAQIEDKVAFGKLLENVLTQGGMEKNLIPNTVLTSGQSYGDLVKQLSSQEGPLYFQIALSAGGDGTVKVSSAEDMRALLDHSEWAAAVNKGNVKVSKGIVPNYPANGTGCIVPTPDGKDCTIYLDPPSHKPVGLPELGAKQGSGVGNDWSHPFPSAYIEQYARMSELVGRALFMRYGYTGLFGPDGIMDTKNRRFHMTEVNPRIQGTTPYQTHNALANGRVPIEWMHLMTKLAGTDPNALGALRDIIGPPTNYNHKSLMEKGGYYIKVGGPKERKVVQKDLNGAYGYTRGKPLVRLDLTEVQVYGGKYANNTYERVVYLKGPQTGTMIGGELAPVGYIVGRGEPVFAAETPTILPGALDMYRAVQEEMLGTGGIMGGNIYERSQD